MAFAVSVAGSAVAASTEHEHVALPTDVTLSMTDALDYTVTRYPSFLELDARGEEAQAWSERGDSWLAGQPALSFRYQTDRWGDDRGLPIDDVVIEGARRRLRPVLMTASIAAFGLVPPVVRNRSWVRDTTTVSRGGYWRTHYGNAPSR